MTVIAYRDGVLAADTAIWQGNLLVGHRHKIRRLKDGRLYAASGFKPDCDEFFAYLNGKQPEPPKPLDNRDYFDAIVVAPEQRWKADGKFRLYDVSGDSFVTVGAHCDFLIGAMAAGASAEEAVRLAIRHGDSAGGDVQVERVEVSELRRIPASAFQDRTDPFHPGGPR